MQVDDLARQTYKFLVTLPHEGLENATYRYRDGLRFDFVTVVSCLSVCLVLLLAQQLCGPGVIPL